MKGKKQVLIIRQINVNINQRFRSSPSEVFLRKVVLKTYSKFTGEHPC